jgi:hypothetical protein
MHSVLRFGVMLISLVPCLFVLLRVDEQATEDQMLSRWKILSRSSLKASCALDHIYLPDNVLYNHFGMFRLNFMGPNRSSQSALPYALITTELLDSPAIAICGFGC